MSFSLWNDPEMGTIGSYEDPSRRLNTVLLGEANHLLCQTTFFAPVIMEPFRNSNGLSHTVSDKILFVTSLHGYLDFLLLAFLPMEVFEIQIHHIIPRLSPLWKLPKFFLSFSSMLKITDIYKCRWNCTAHSSMFAFKNALV